MALKLFIGPESHLERHRYAIHTPATRNTMPKNAMQIPQMSGLVSVGGGGDGGGGDGGDGGGGGGIPDVN